MDCQVAACLFVRFFAIVSWYFYRLVRSDSSTVCPASRGCRDFRRMRRRSLRGGFMRMTGSLIHGDGEGTKRSQLRLVMIRVTDIPGAATAHSVSRPVIPVGRPVFSVAVLVWQSRRQRAVVQRPEGAAVASPVCAEAMRRCRSGSSPTAHSVAPAARRVCASARVICPSLSSTPTMRQRK